MPTQKRTAIYPGTFDPVTYGHMDVLNRALQMFDEVVIGVATASGKHPLFDTDTRLRLIEENICAIPRVRACLLSGLTVDFAREYGAVAIIRGLRAVSDFEYEFQLAQMNRHLDREIETVPSHALSQVFLYELHDNKAGCRIYARQGERICAAKRAGRHDEGAIVRRTAPLLTSGICAVFLPARMCRRL